jgi:Flp pilus assembly protein TadB
MTGDLLLLVLFALVFALVVAATCWWSLAADRRRYRRLAARWEALEDERMHHTDPEKFKKEMRDRWNTRP